MDPAFLRVQSPLVMLDIQDWIPAEVGIFDRHSYGI